MYQFIHFETPLGKMISISKNNTIFLVDFIDNEDDKTYISKLKNQYKLELIETETELLHQLKIELAEYFESKRKVFSAELSPEGTDFQKLVWQKLRAIPYGETKSYKQQSELMNKLLAIRSIASANGKNKIAILIPCHRIIGNNGKLTGYAGGLWRKQYLLDLEKKTINNGQKFLLFD